MLQKIICVDDDPIALLLSRLIITKTNYTSEIITAINGQEALSYLSQEKIINENKDNKNNILILLDLNMPIMDGWDFLEEFGTQLAHQYTNIKIILLSSSVDPSDIQKSKTYPIVLDFLPKPLTKETLNIIIEKLK
ncbi:MAG TPA: response regulator [Flavobacterium sp.]